MALTFLSRYDRFALAFLYMASVFVMIVDLCLHLDETIFFYTMTNAILLFRICGVHWVTLALHVISFVYILICFILFMTVESVFSYDPFNTWVFVAPLIFQVLLSLHLVVFRPGKTPEEKARRCGIHALIGNAVVIISFWHYCFLGSVGNARTFLEMGYMLLFLFMILTPYFLTSKQAAVLAYIAVQQRELALGEKEK